MLRLHTFGGCFLARDGARLETASAQRKGLALLAILAAAGEHGLSRDAVVGLLWPENDDERARTSLRQLVHSLRTQLDTPELLVASAELRLNPAAIASDVADFENAIQTNKFGAAVALYTGPFLDGFFVKAGSEFERWLDGQRASRANEFTQSLTGLAHQAEEQGDLPSAARYWRRITEAEPLSAQSAVNYMRALDALGERAAALQHARVYELLVREELGDVPDAMVSMLADELRTAPATTRAAPSTLSSIAISSIEPPPQQRILVKRRRAPLVAGAVLLVLLVTGVAIATWSRVSNPAPASIAVLPLINTSGNPGDEALSDGLTENLIAALAREPELRVIARTSAFAFKNRSADLRTIADTLGVTAVLEGSVQRVGDQLKVHTQLVNAADATVAWSATYDRELSDIFAVQDEITSAIVTALSRRLSKSPRRGGGSRELRNVQAYELYLRGRRIFTTRTDREGIDQASSYFLAALRSDPLLAEAHAGISDIHARLAVFGYVPARDGYARAKEHAIRALALDSSLAEAHTSLGHAYCVADYDLESAERAFKRAVALNPAYTFGRLPYAICLMSQGRFKEAEAQLNDARSYDPLSPAVSNLFGRLYVYMQQPDKGIANLKQALELSPQMDLAYQQLGHAYLQKGRLNAAINAFERAAALSGARDSLHLAYAYGIVGRRGEAQKIIESVMRTPESSAALAYHLALAYTGLGDNDAAFAWLDRGAADRRSFVVAANVDPALKPLHADQRWKPLMKRIGID